MLSTKTITPRYLRTTNKFAVNHSNIKIEKNYFFMTKQTSEDEKIRYSIKSLMSISLS